MCSTATAFAVGTSAKLKNISSQKGFGKIFNLRTLGTAAWNRNSVMFERLLLVAVTFIDKEPASDDFSSENIIFRPSLSKAVNVGTCFSAN